MATSQVSVVKITTATPKPATAKVSYTTEGQKGFFNVPVGAQICTYSYSGKEKGYFFGSDNITNESGTETYGHCRTIKKDTNIGKITPIQAEELAIVKNADNKPDLTKNDLKALDKERPYKHVFDFKRPNFTDGPSLGNRNYYSETYESVNLDVVNVSTLKHDGIIIDLSKTN